MVKDNSLTDTGEPAKQSNKQDIIRPQSRQSFLNRNIKGASNIVFSPAYRLIEQRIVRYLDGYERGFSILLSALRGMGKTSLVLHIINKYQRQDSDKSKFDRARPLPIELDAPTVWSAFESHLIEHKNLEDNESTARIFRKVFLEQLTTNLYRSFSRELTICFEEKQREIANASNYGKLIHPELLGRLTIALMNTAQASVFRNIWQQAGVLQRGILFNTNEPYCPPDSRSIQLKSRVGRSIEAENQGIKEIIAIVALTHSFRKLTGKYEVLSKHANNLSESREFGFVGKVSSADLLALVSVLSGALLAGKDQFWSGLVAALMGLIFFMFSYSLTSKQNRNQEEAFNYEPQTDSDSLSRDMPYMLGCVTRCGVAPIFIIDELDKLNEAQLDRFLGWMKGFKHIITEKAFFIYLGSLRAAALVHAKDVEASRFSSLFKVRTQLYYLPEEVISWVGTQIFDQALQDSNVEHQDLQLWAMKTILSARMSMLKINQQLWELCEQIQPSPDERKPNIRRLLAVNDDASWHHVSMYVAIEVVINDVRNRSWFALDPLAEIYAREGIYFCVEIWDQIVDWVYSGKDNLGVRQFMFSNDGITKDQGDLATKHPKRMLDYLGKRIGVNIIEKIQSSTCWFKPVNIDNLVYNILQVFDLLADPPNLVAAVKKHYYDHQATDEHKKGVPEHWLVKRLNMQFVPQGNNETVAPLCSRTADQDVLIQYDRSGMSFEQFEFDDEAALEQLGQLESVVRMLESYLGH